MHSMFLGFDSHLHLSLSPQVQGLAGSKALPLPGNIQLENSF